MWELDYRESWVPKNWCFWTVVLEKTLESPLDCKEIQPVHPKGNQSWIFIGRTDVEAEALTLRPPDAKSWLNWTEGSVAVELSSVWERVLFSPCSVQFSHSVMSDSATLWTAACQASRFSTNPWSLLKLMSIELVMPSNYLIFCHPLLPPSIFPTIRAFPNESALCIINFMAEVTICSDFGALQNKVCHCFHCFSICHEVMGLDAWSLFSECWALSQLFHSPLSLSSRGFLVILHFLP